MLKVSKHTIFTSLITVIIFSSIGLLASFALMPFTDFIMKDILLLVGLTTCTIGSLSLIGESSSSVIINPFVRLTPVLINNCEEITKEDLDMGQSNSQYVHSSIHHLRKSTFEFALSGGLLLLVALI